MFTNERRFSVVRAFLAISLMLPNKPASCLFLLKVLSAQILRNLSTLFIQSIALEQKRCVCTACSNIFEHAGISKGTDSL